MACLKLIYSRTPTPTSYAIRTLTLSHWSHVGILCDGMVIEAQAGLGVVCRSLEASLKGVSDFQIVEYRNIQEGPVVSFALDQVGKPYDYTALFGILAGRNWQDQSSWFCSELTASALHAANYPIFQFEACSRVVPQHLWLLSPDIYTTQQ